MKDTMIRENKVHHLLGVEDWQENIFKYIYNDAKELLTNEINNFNTLNNFNININPNKIVQINQKVNQKLEDELHELKVSSKHHNNNTNTTILTKKTEKEITTTNKQMIL